MGCSRHERRLHVYRWVFEVSIALAFLMPLSCIEQCRPTRGYTAVVSWYVGRIVIVGMALGWIIFRSRG